MTRRDEWLGVGRSCVALNPPLKACVTAGLALARPALADRLVTQHWVRYAIDLGAPPPAPPEVRLTPVTDALIAALRTHRDHRENQLVSGFRFWDRGLRGAWVWTGDEGPLCIQWLMTPRDNARLPALGEWAGMYPPLPEGTGRVENLFTFSTVRRKGVATMFELALFEEARRLGLTRIVTHIAADNVSANRWAERMGWALHGTITRYQVDAPWVRRAMIYVHRDADAAPAPAGHAAAGADPAAHAARGVAPGPVAP